jgi:hypothetical protein
MALELDWRVRSHDVTHFLDHAFAAVAKETRSGGNLCKMPAERQAIRRKPIAQDASLEGKDWISEMNN